MLATLLLTTLSLQAPAESPLSLTLDLSGTVTRENRPVAGALVRLFYRHLPLPKGESSLAAALVERSVRTGEDGGFRIPLPIGRKASLFASKDGATSAILDRIVAGTSDLKLELRPAQDLVLHFRYRRKPPGKEFAVRLRRRSHHPEDAPLEFSGTCGSDGLLRVRGLPEASWKVLLAGGDLPDRRLKKPAFVTNDGKEHVLDLKKAITLEGELLAGGPMGRPVPFAEFELLDGTRLFRGRADAAGRMILPGLDFGPGATLVIRAEGWGKHVYALEPGLSPEDPAPQFRISLRSGREVSGKVVDISGRPLPNFELVFAGVVHPSGLPVEEMSFLVRTGEDGTFRSSEMDPFSAYDLYAMLPGGEAQQIRTIFSDTSPVDLGTIKIGSGRVRARLVLGKETVPPPVELRLYGPKEYGEWSKFRRLYRMKDGTYLSPVVADGEYVLIAFSKERGFSRVGLRVSRAPNRPAVLDVRIGIGRIRKIEGVVVDQDAKPVSGRTVSLVPQGGSEEGGPSKWTDIVLETLSEEIFPPKDFPRKAMTDANGKFTIWCLEGGGAYDLYVSSGAPAEPGQIPSAENTGTRVEHILGRPNPVTVHVMH